MELTTIQSSVTLFEILCVIIVFASLFMRSRYFNEVFERHPAWTTQILLMVFFGIMSIFGTLSGLSIYGAVVNVRDLGPMAAGLLCGPTIGIGSGIIGGLFRFFQGGPYMWTGLSAPILSGFLGGIMYLVNKKQFVPTWVAVLLIGLSETLISCYTLILVTKPSEFFTVVMTVAIPMIVFNVIGMFIFALIVHNILDERSIQEKMQLLELEVESKKNLSTIINTISHPVYVLDRNHRFILVNDSLCRFIGRPRDEILVRMPRDFFGEADSAFHQDLTDDLNQSPASREDEVTIIKPDGQKRIVITTSTVFKDAPCTGFVVGVIHDITGRKHAEEALHAREIRYRRLFESTHDGILILDADTGQIVDVNPFLIGLLGFSHEQFLGKKIWDIGIFKDIIANKENFEELQREEYIRYDDLPLETSDGRQIFVEFISNVYVVNNAKVIQCNIRDITERKRTDAALRETTEYLNNLFNFANAPMIVWDPEFRITRFNHAFEHLTGRKEKDVLGQPLDILFPPQSRDALLALIKKTLEGEQWDTVEIPILTTNGSVLTALWNSANILRADKKIISTIAQGVDITERKKMTEQIAASLTEKETLLKEVYHRVKNNLQIIVSLINLQIRKIDDPMTIEALRDCQNQVRSMALVHEHLYRGKDFSHIDLGNYIRALGTGLLTMNEAQKRGIRFDLDIHDIYVDTNTAIPLGLISNELITNSIKYGFRGKDSGRIFITATEDLRFLTFTVADDGAGMSPDITFENQTSLGLKLVNMLTDQLNGTVVIDRTEGTKFTFTFLKPEEHNPGEGATK